MPWKPDYVDLATMKHDLGIDDTQDDAELAVAISAASRSIDDYCNRQFGVLAAPELRYYPARWDDERCLWIVDIDDLQTTVGLVHDLGYTAVPEPRNAVADGKAWTALAFEEDPRADDGYVPLTAPWGWSLGCPDTVVMASKLQTGRILARRHAPFGIAGSPDAGSEMRLLARVDPDVAVVLRGYRRPRRAG